MSQDYEQLSFVEPIRNTPDRHRLNDWISVSYKKELKTATLFLHDKYVKQVDLKDRVEKKLFFVELVEMGAKQIRIAEVFGISRQTLHNYMETKKRMGVEALIYSWQGTNKKEQRKLKAEKISFGNKNDKLRELRRLETEKRKAEADKNRQISLLDFPQEAMEEIEAQEQPFSQEHDWKSTRYAGVSLFFAPLCKIWRWMDLVQAFLGCDFRIMLIFLLMSARNVRSIEQMKHMRAGEAGTLLGIGKLPVKSTIHQWFWSAANRGQALKMCRSFFQHQIRAGIVSVWLWLTDGHLLPYTGKDKVHHAFNTQRRLPMPGRTSLVTCDVKGMVVDFEIEEGKGNLKERIFRLADKWEKDAGRIPVMVFDREGSGTEFYYLLTQRKIPFVCWEKNSDVKKLKRIAEDRFNLAFKFNGKNYTVFEEEKKCIYHPQEVDRANDDKEVKKGKEVIYYLRRIYLHNMSSHRKICVLSWSDESEMSTIDCAKAILSRWGASENTFKHQKDRHPLHYDPGLTKTESEDQSVANPQLLKLRKRVKKLKATIIGLRAKIGATEKKFNKDGTERRNSAHARLSDEISDQQKKLQECEVEKKTLPDRVNVSQLEDYRSFKTIDNEGKYLFDLVTASVWNVRKLMVDWLIEYDFYNDERDVVDLVYAMLNCQGWVKSTSEEVIFRMEPLQQPKRRIAQESMCRKLNELCARTQTGKWFYYEVGENPGQELKLSKKRA